MPTKGTVEGFVGGILEVGPLKQMTFPAVSFRQRDLSNVPQNVHNDCLGRHFEVP